MLQIERSGFELLISHCARLYLALTNTIWSAFKEILCELLRKPCKVPKVFFIERGKVSSCRYQFGLLALLNENWSIHKLYVITTPKLIRGEEKIDLAAVP